MDFIEDDILVEIIAGCKKHNSQAQHRLYELYAKRMTALCYRYCYDRELARDLIHDGFVRVFSYIDDFNEVGSFEGWLKKIFLNVALDRLRRADAMKDAISVDGLENFIADRAPDFTQKINIEDIFKAIGKLPDVARTVFNMHDIDGFSLEDIAKELNMTASAVRSQHARAKQKLQIMLKSMKN
jgi:RNA polymerase sigma-70 factor (ECF subfamily)